METRAHHVLIGLFTVLVVAAALLFGLWLTKSSADSEFTLYDIVFNEAVTGLSKGSAVQYSGIKVGDVVQLKLDPKDPRKVRARVRLAGDTPVKQNTRAKLALTGITGGAFIQLHSGSPDSPKLESENGEVAVIVADPSPISTLLANGEDLLTNINKFVDSANQMLSPENAARISRTLEHLDLATGVLAEQRNDIREMVQQLASASKQASLTLEQSAQLMRTANGLLDKQGKGAFDGAQQAMAALERASRNIAHLLNDNHDSLNAGVQGLSEIGPAVSELRETLSGLRSITRRLEEDPASYLLGGDKTKEFEP
ncbi:MCE family protein [Pseudomonas cavernicola]|uniref:MCE family protein n=1 Tax=Pseudomonas cavernicola TaxID=2320866 RepID=A0A418XLG7_9PSED|nr:MlaD family protein [Pseudomonas cavernicola]RJG13313.1 MCE family protein [Pseudomonas cavernicola]